MKKIPWWKRFPWWRLRAPFPISIMPNPWVGAPPDSEEREYPPPLPDCLPYPKNAPGDFYSVDQQCMLCGRPHTVAPDLLTWDLDDQGRQIHCYFKKQPETRNELEQAIKALEISCGSLRYRGDNPEVLRRLHECGKGHVID